jgi:response regulator
LKKILVIDDDVQILKLIEKILIKEQYAVTVKTKINFRNITEFLGYDLILLDVMLEDKVDGFDICAHIRDEVASPIIFLTAKNTEDDLVCGFSVGADDYIKKPFTPNELLARIDAHIRREKRKIENVKVIVSGNITIHMDMKKVFIMGKDLNLTPKEYKIVELLATHSSKTYTVEEIYENIYDLTSETLFRGISEHIHQVRKKFREYKLNPIATVWGVGYRWEE